MKTSVIGVHEMLSVWSADEVEERIGKVPGVGSVTVNYAAESATVRYDETRLRIGDIKSAVRQGGFESGTPAASAGDGHEGHPAPVAPPATPASGAAKTSPVAPAAAGAAPAGDGQEGKPSPGAPAAPAGGGHQDKAAPAAVPSTPVAPH